MKNIAVTVIGGGLAGAEAAWQAAERGLAVRLFEMRPGKMTPAHRSGDLAELVCSNSLKSEGRGKAHGLLKEEMKLFGSLVLDAAEGARVPAGSALAVDRTVYAAALTRRVESHPLIEVIREEVRELPAAGTVVVAAGPLASSALASSIAGFTGKEHLYFYDAIAPVVLAETIDRDIVFSASRRTSGEGDYLNCPLDEETYEDFVTAVLAARTAPLHEGDEAAFFEGCLPVEEIARRGRETLRFGPMRPIGLLDPRTGRRPHAVVQLRQDNLAAEHYSLVGFQTRLAWPEQERVLRMIPGLENAVFARFGQVHRNSYINAPALLLPTLNTRSRGDLFFAGQIAGVEGYTEAAATGILAGINAARTAEGRTPLLPPPETLLGSLCRYIATAPVENFQPVNVTFGLLPPVPGERGKRRDRRLARAERALATLRDWLAIHSE